MPLNTVAFAGEYLVSISGKKVSNLAVSGKLKPTSMLLSHDRAAVSLLVRE
jgi:hypothetical protein